MSFKKLLSLILVAMLMLSVFSACSKDEEKEADSKPADHTTSEAAEENATTEKSETAGETGVQSGTAASEDDVSEDTELGGSEAESANSAALSETDDSSIGGNGSKPAESDLPVVTLVGRKNADGTVTISARLPYGIGNGKIVLSVSDKLSYVSGSAASDIGAVINDTGAFNGIGASFATATFYDEDATALSATYTVNEGASITTDDFWCDQWKLGDGTAWLSSNEDCAEKKLLR